MTKLECLIAELCPDGVEYKKLTDVAIINRGVRLIKNQLFESGKYPVYQNSMTPLGYYGKKNNNANTTFIISAGAAGEIGYSDVDFWAADDCFCFICLEYLQNRYLYYALLCQQNYLFSKVRKASVPRLARTVIEQLQIPLPPLPVQYEIVRILDNFTELTNELTNELTTRIKQYEYYRNYLLTFNDIVKNIDNRQSTIDNRKSTVSRIKWMTLNEVSKIIRGTYITKNESIHGEIPVILGGKEPAYYCDTANHYGEAIVISRSGAYAGFVSYWNQSIYVTDGFIIEKNYDLLIKYLYYYLKNIQNLLYLMKHSGGVPHIRGNEIMKIKIPIPSIEEQKRIVSILDRFDALTTDITNGLPAEIAARQKQYEYYCNKLLSFKEIS